MMTQAIFLSYASQDADAARRICEALRAAGLEVWFDQNELRGGDAWDASIRKQIKECALFVPIISDNTDARAEGYFRLEWKLAVDRSHLMADDQPFFVPVILDDTKEATARVPEKFRERQWTRLNDDGSIQAFAARVAKLTDGSGSSGKNASSSPSNDEFVALATARKTVAPTGVGKRVGAKVSSTSHEQPILGPDLHRDDSTESVADTSDGASSAHSKPTVVAPSSGTPSATPKSSPSSRRSRTVVAFAAVVIIAGATAAWFAIDHNRKRAFVAEGIIKIDALTRGTKFSDAYQLAEEMKRAGGGDLLTDQIKNGYSRPVNVESKPVGASIAIRPFGDGSKEPPWIELGKAPLQKIRVPRGALEWRATLAGHQPERQLRYANADMQISFALWPPGSAEAAMVPVGGGVFAWGGMSGIEIAQKVTLAPYLIDREELTNRDYAKFVQSGGYTREEFWKEAFRDDANPGAKTLTFKEAIAKFKDATGRTGPATWKLGNYPNGEADLPVRGISWYEAAAYAAFAGRELPTLYHWYFADNNGDRYSMPGVLLPAANFESAAVLSAATTKTVSAFGAVNMAGNVREWVSNQTDRWQRLAVGGSLSDTAYQYSSPDARSAFDRAPDIGARTMKRTTQPTASTTDPAFAVLTEKPRADLAKIKPVSDAEYAIYTRFFEQRPAPLDVKVESVDQSSPKWILTKVSYAAGYGGERMNAFLYAPKNAKPPYQTMIFLPGGSGFGNFRPYANEPDAPGWNFIDQLVRGGRAVLVPIWKGSFERSFESVPGLAAARDLYVQHVSDLRQSIAFLATRPEVDQDRIGYHGVSYGASRGVVLLALEPRLKAGILVVGGISLIRANGDLLPPELSNATYAPRVKASVLMINGRDDAINPYESSQVPLFKLLGSPPGKKKHKTYPGGHFVFGWYDDIARDTHDWLDEQFGPVKPAASGSSK